IYLKVAPFSFPVGLSIIESLPSTLHACMIKSLYSLLKSFVINFKLLDTYDIPKGFKLEFDRFLIGFFHCKGQFQDETLFWII
ncbi:hypothetical protein, partial [Bacillus thuringiensis]|uniref:hypothetical protein n=1 Tax=Bacillus thuringiensis TaxID=1428 RepID=UPI001C92D70F